MHLGDPFTLRVGHVTFDIAHVLSTIDDPRLRLAVIGRRFARLPGGGTGCAFDDIEVF
jgi:hypothetical protein